MINIYKLKHFYINKYIISPFIGRKYYLSYNYKYNALWFRTYKVASRTIDQHFRENTSENQYIYSSRVGYVPAMFKNYFKFAFVRDPLEKFLSAWKQKVIMTNSFRFSEQEHQNMKKLEHFVDWVETLDINNCDEHLQSQQSMVDLDNIDFIGRFENFEQDFKFVANKLGITIDELQSYMDMPLKTYKDYKSQRNIYMIGAKVMRILGLEKGGKR